MPSMPILVNIVLFQIGWFACVLGAAQGLPWAGTLVAVVIASVHLVYAKRRRAELQLLLLVVTLGFAWDSAVTAMGLMQFSTGRMLSGLAPYWIAAMWLSFATTLNVSLRWLRGRAWLAALLGAVGGPLAYFAGAKLGALSFPQPLPGLAAQALGWALLMPLLIKLATRFDGVARSSAEGMYV
jgi:hypothetical protein